MKDNELTAPREVKPTTKEQNDSDNNDGNIVIEGLENFSYVDLPPEEV